MKIRSRKAISPVIATVILVAVAITVAVAVAYWMGGIAGQYTKFEKIEIQSATCTIDSNGNWIVNMTLKNTGTATASLISVYVNDVEVTGYDASAPGSAVDTLTTSMNITASFTITPGLAVTIEVYVGANYGTLSSGTTVNIKIHSAGGMDYIKLVELV